MELGRRRLLTGSIGLGACALGSVSTVADALACGVVPEMPLPGLPDIAFVTWNFPHQNPQFGGYVGPIIYFNPYVTNRVGPLLTAYFQAHEYGHVCLAHIQQHLFATNPWARQWMSLTHELQADSFATRAMIARGNIDAVRAAFQWFHGQGPVQVVPSHPPGTARAQNIFVTAQRAGVHL